MPLHFRRHFGLSAVVGLFLVGCSSGDTQVDNDGNRNELIDGAVTPGAPGPGACTPGSVTDCYDGPVGTLGVGLCTSGTQTCLPDGTAYGPCDGQVLPSAERCATPGDDDCNGLTNEGGPDCSCTPGQSVTCYSGPPSTQGVGACKGGTQSCNAEGTGYGPCLGQVLPTTEDCATAIDEDCDGQAPPCPDAVIDIRADNNRDGFVDLNDPTEDANEASWSSANGAVFLANLDDDQNSCPKTGTDSSLAKCNDAADDVINGSGDLLDLARLKTAPWPGAPSNASAKLSVANPGKLFVRLFKKSGNTWSLYTPGTTISAADLRAGVEFALEGKDILRNANQWDGYVGITWTVDGGTGPNGPVGGGSDALELRMAPVIFRHHLHPAKTYYVTQFDNYAPSTVFRQDMAQAASAAGVGGVGLKLSDQWTQDFFETAYMSMPATGGKQHVIDVNFRSANYTQGSLRSAGRVVFNTLRGPDVAGAVQYSTSHNDSMDTLNSFGNFETIPPYTHNNKSWPLGRVIRGSQPQYYPDPAFTALVEAQGVQEPVSVDTSWLLVAHIDETVSFIKANSPRGWVMLANDATLAKTMLQQQQQFGYGSKQMFVGKYWSGNNYAAASINQVLADPDVMNESAWAAVKTDAQVDIIKNTTGLKDSEIVSVPFLHYEANGYSLAYQPGTVNGIYLADKHFGAPDPHGPSINGKDIFKTQLTAALGAYGVTVHYIEDWDLYHALSGEVHCGSNTTRVVPDNDKWWESGL